MNLKKVLMLCYYFPPIDAVGSRRSEGFARYLPEFGWEPVVLTVIRSREPWAKSGASIPKDLSIFRAPEYNLAGLLNKLHGFTSKLAGLAGIELKRNYLYDFLPGADPQLSWAVVSQGVELAKDCDIIYVSCSPFSAATKAVQISHAAKKPLVTDFRDAWSLNPHISRPPRVQRKIQKLEKEVIRASEKIILNTPGAEVLYRDEYPRFAEKFITITNGYDSLNPVIREPLNGGFRVMHLGNFYLSRSPQILLEALARINNPLIEFIHVGERSAEIEGFSNRVNIKQLGVIPADKCGALMASASLLFVMQGWEEGVKSYVAVAQKTYEYLATGLPILCFAPAGDNTEIIRKYAVRAYIVSERCVDLMVDAIRTAYSERNLRFPAISGEFISQFDRKKLTCDLAEVFNAISVD